jgi:hypothetical protein
VRVKRPGTEYFALPDSPDYPPHWSIDSLAELPRVLEAGLAVLE